MVASFIGNVLLEDDVQVAGEGPFLCTDFEAAALSDANLLHFDCHIHVLQDQMSAIHKNNHV